MGEWTKWDKRFMDMAKMVGSWSSCFQANRQIGAVIVRNKRIITTGYNGAPAGVMSCVERGECLRRKLNIPSGTQHELCYAIHAEQNAIIQAAKLGSSIEGATLYCTHQPCVICAKMIVNSVGLVAFMRILDRLNRDLTIELVEQRAVALLIAQECLPYLRKGIRNREDLQRAVDIVREKLPHFQVALTDRTQVLAASGCDLSVTPLPIAAREAMAQRETVVMEVSKGHRSAMLSAPLVTDEQVIGALLLIAPTGPNLVLDADVKTLESLAQFFSVMLELGETEHQIALRKQAEFRALQSQINPHFLFNALNTISALCMTDPDRACKTILILANYFRQTLTINEPFVPLEQEISNVDNYLMLTEARFEGALHVECELPDDLRALRLPPLILQPVVENAVRHGFVAVDDRRVAISIRQDDKRAYIRVSDQGHGFPPEVLKKLEDPNDPTYTGLFNVRKRLRSIYGEQCDFHIDSSDKGSTVSFSLPLIPPEMPDAE